MLCFLLLVLCSDLSLLLLSGFSGYSFKRLSLCGGFELSWWIEDVNCEMLLVVVFVEHYFKFTLVLLPAICFLEQQKECETNLFCLGHPA